MLKVISNISTSCSTHAAPCFLTHSTTWRSALWGDSQWDRLCASSQCLLPRPIVGISASSTVLGTELHATVLLIGGSVCHAGTTGSPAYVATSRQAGHQTWQYMMPKQAVDSAACPVGHGSGTFASPTEAQSLVAVVGTAHVYGIMQHLQRLQNHS